MQCCNRNMTLKLYLSILIALGFIYFLWQYFSFSNQVNIADYIFSSTIYSLSFCKAKSLQCPTTYKYCNSVFREKSLFIEESLLDAHPNLPKFLLRGSKKSCLIPDIQK